jgi:hypothetical protein
MNRLRFLRHAGLLTLGGAGLAGWRLWPEAGVINPCRAGLPPELAGHELMGRVWQGIDPAQVLEALLARPDWHGRLLNGADYPLPGILPLIFLERLVSRGLLAAEAKSFLMGLREHNPLLFDFALKRLLRRNGRGFANSVFETRAFFERKTP